MYLRAIKPLYDILDKIFEADKDFADSVNGSIADDDNIQDVVPPVVKDPILPLNYVLKEFYDMLINGFGLINPDELQLTKDDIVRFDAIMDADKPFELGFDRLGANRLDVERYPMPINPDE